MIDITTHGPDGHWDYADIVRLCEYRDRLRTALEKIAANNDFLFLAEMAEFAREALASEHGDKP